MFNNSNNNKNSLNLKQIFELELQRDQQFDRNVCEAKKRSTIILYKELTITTGADKFYFLVAKGTRALNNYYISSVFSSPLKK